MKQDNTNIEDYLEEQMGGGMYQKVYVVFIGCRLGIYDVWYEWRVHVNGFICALY